MYELSGKRAKWAKRVLVGSMLVMGACGIVYEYVLSVLGNYLMGSSYEQIFIVIGIMMFAMGVGAAFQRHVSGDLLDKFLLLEIILGILGGTSALLIYSAYASTESYRVILYGFAFALGCLIGMEIPILIRINKDYSSSLKVNLSEILSMDYVGSLLGAIAFTYIFLKYFSLAKISIMLGITNTSIALIGLILFWPLIRRKSYILPAALSGIVVLSAGYLVSDDWMEVIEQKYYRDPVIYRTTSPYQHIVLTKRGERLNLYINGHLQFSSTDEHIYHEMLVHVPMAVAPRRDRVLILGGGDGLALREVIKYPDVREVTLVDIDPAVVRMAATHPDLVTLNDAAFLDSRTYVLTSGAVSPGERISVLQSNQRNSQIYNRERYEIAQVRVFNIDADRFVEEIPELYDVAIIDFPDPNIIELSKLYTLDFYSALRGKLTDAGVLSVQSTSPYFAKDAFLSIGKTLRAAGYRVLPYHQNVPSFGEWGWHLAWKRGHSERGMLAAIDEIGDIEVPTQYLSREVFVGSFVFGKGWLVPSSEIEVNTKLRPVLLTYYNRAFKGF